MAILFSCPCGGRLKAKDDHGGKRVKCPQCSAVVVVPAESLRSPSAPSAPSAARRGDESTQAPRDFNPFTELSPHPLLSGAFATAEGRSNDKPTVIDTSPTAHNVKARFVCRGGFYWGLKTEVYFDDRLIGSGTARKGFDIATTTSVGAHKLEVTLFGMRKPFAVTFTAPGEYEATLTLRGWTSGFPDAYADALSIVSRSSGASAAAIAGDAGYVAALVGGQVPFFSAKIPAGGPLGFAENATTLFYGPGAAVLSGTLREAKIEIEDGQVKVCASETGGGWHTIHSLKVTDLFDVQTSAFGFGAMFKLHLMRIVAMGFAMAITLGAGLLIQSEQIRRDVTGELALGAMFAAICVVGGLLFAGLFLLHGLFKNRKPHTRLHFKTRDAKHFSLLVDAAQLTAAREFFRQAKISMN